MISHTPHPRLRSLLTHHAQQLKLWPTLISNLIYAFILLLWFGHSVVYAESVDVAPEVRPITPAAAKAAVLSPAMPSSIPLRRDSDTTWENDGSKLYSAMLLIAVLAAFAGWILWRKGRTHGLSSSSIVGLPERWFPAPFADGLRVKQSTQLTPRNSVHLLHWDNHEWLVGCTENSVIVLGQRALPTDDQDPTDIAPRGDA